MLWGGFFIDQLAPLVEKKGALLFELLFPTYQIGLSPQKSYLSFWRPQPKMKVGDFSSWDSPVIKTGKQKIGEIHRNSINKGNTNGGNYNSTTQKRIMWFCVTVCCYQRKWRVSNCSKNQQDHGYLGTGFFSKSFSSTDLPFCWKTQKVNGMYSLRKTRSYLGQRRIEYMVSYGLLHPGTPKMCWIILPIIPSCHNPGSQLRKGS